jgi:hypothetical protein
VPTHPIECMKMTMRAFAVLFCMYVPLGTVPGA